MILLKHTISLRWWVACFALAAASCSADAGPDASRGSVSGTPGTSGITAQGGGAQTSGAPGSPSDTFGNANSTVPPAPAGMLPEGVAGNGGACAQGDATATPVTPNVWLVVDGSSSMNTNFGAGGTRWETLRTTLMEPGGIVDSLQGIVRFGLVIYSGGGLLECVQLVTEQPALNNYAVLDAAYPAQPIGTGTPTHHALEHVVTNLPVLNTQTLDSMGDPTYVVLATDGQPNDPCDGGGGGLGRGNNAQVEQAVLDVVMRGVQGGMRMFVISLAGGDPQLQAHLDQVAVAGDTGEPAFVPATRDELVMTFQRIVGGATCQVALDGMVEAGQQCQGEVLLNGNPLDCDSDDGWRLSDPRTVQLTGNACDLFVSNQSLVRASFPCGVFSPD